MTGQKITCVERFSLKKDIIYIDIIFGYKCTFEHLHTLSAVITLDFMLQARRL